jgi:subtilase family serine protease
MALPDLTVTVVAPDLVLIGQEFEASFTIRNDGTGPAGTFHYGYGGPGGSGAGEIAGLAPGEEYSDTATFTAPPESGSVQITVTADTDPLITETAEDNNEATREVGVINISIPSIDIDLPF